MSAYIKEVEQQSNCKLCGEYSREQMYTLNTENRYTYNISVCKKCIQSLKENIDKLDLNS